MRRLFAVRSERPGRSTVRAASEKRWAATANPMRAFDWSATALRSNLLLRPTSRVKCRRRLSSAPAAWRACLDLARGSLAELLPENPRLRCRAQMASGGAAAAVRYREAYAM